MERFTIASGRKESTWVAVDHENGIVVRFDDHQFNDTQRATVLEESNLSALQLAKAMRELGDWLRDNHYDKIF